MYQKDLSHLRMETKSSSEVLVRPKIARTRTKGKGINMNTPEEMFKPKYDVLVPNKYPEQYPVAYFSYTCYNKSDLKFLCDILDSVPIPYQVNSL